MDTCTKNIQERKNHLEEILKKEFHFFITHIKHLPEFWTCLKPKLLEAQSEDSCGLLKRISSVDQIEKEKSQNLKYIFKLLTENLDKPEENLIDALEKSGNFIAVEFIKYKLDEISSKCAEIPEIIFSDEIDFVRSRHNSSGSSHDKCATPEISGFDTVDSIFDKGLLNLVFSTNASPQEEKHPLADATVPEMIEEAGYPCESHEIGTKDGYILTAHRIPFGKNRNEGCFNPTAAAGSNENSGTKRVIWVQHGLLSSSADWIMNYEERALAYMLADQNFDVWLGNARGNKYSRQHSHLNISGREFWDFSFHEMGVYDLPAILNYVLRVTGQEKLTWIGHSMGCAMFLIGMSTYPHLNEKIDQMIGLGPVGFVSNMTSPLRILTPLTNYKIDVALDFLGTFEFLPNAATKGLLARIVPYESKNHYVLSNLMFIICGFDYQQMNECFMPIILSHAPAGASTKTLIHFSQLVNSKLFQSFDYGPERNLKIYGSREPIQYDMCKVTCPVTLFYANNDWLTVPEDVEKLARCLPNLKGLHKVELDSFTHLDFLWAKDADKYVYYHIINILNT